MKPILFSTPMVQAILAGNKTQTRRVVKFPGDYNVHRYEGPDEYGELHSFNWGHIVNGMCFDGVYDNVRAPYKRGDVLWVRETWKPQDYLFVDNVMSCQIIFKAGGPDNLNPRVFWNHGDDTIFESCGTWHPSIHMPREAARIFLKVTDVLAEQVQDILCGDMKREGCIPPTVTGGQYQQWQRDYWIPLWDSINAKRGYGWNTNPWVWVISFEKTEKPEVDG